MLSKHEHLVNVTHYPKDGFQRQYWIIEVKTAAINKKVYKKPDFPDGTITNNIGVFLNWIEKF